MENSQHLNIMRKNNFICVDFDGTCVTHDYPRVGHDIGAIPVLKKLVKQGYKLILFTMRSDKGVKEGMFESGLSDAVKWFADNDIPLFGIQTNPTQHFWTESPKAYGQIYLDDAALGAPLKFDEEISDRPFYDWDKAELMLKEMGVLPYESPIKPSVVYEIIYGATEDMGNSEDVFNIKENIGDNVIGFDFELDTPYADNEGSIIIHTKDKKVECFMPESHEGCGMEREIEKKIKKYLGY